MGWGWIKSSDGHISYGKSERKWAKKNAFHQPKGSNRKMEYGKQICKLSIAPYMRLIYESLFSQWVYSIKSYYEPPIST